MCVHVGEGNQDLKNWGCEVNGSTRLSRPIKPVTSDRRFQVLVSFGGLHVYIVPRKPRWEDVPDFPPTCLLDPRNTPSSRRRSSCTIPSGVGLSQYSGLV